MNEILKTELGNVQKVQIDKLHLIYSEIDNSIEDQQKGWPEFEAKFPSLTGRKLLGLDYDEKNKYRMCSIVKEEDNGDTFGFETFMFEGGTFMRLRLNYEPPELYEKIGPAYNLLISSYDQQIDWSLPFIEQYKARNILDIMVPVKQ